MPWLGWEQSGHDSVAAQPTRGCWGRAGGADLRGRSDLRRGRLLDLALSLQPRPLLCDPPRVGPAAGDPDEATPLLTCQGSMARAQARSLGLDAFQSRRSSPPCYTPDEAPASHVGHVAAGAVTRTPLLQVGGNTTGTDGAAGSISGLGPAGLGAVAAVPPHRSPPCQPGDGRADAKAIGMGVNRQLASDVALALLGLLVGN